MEAIYSNMPAALGFLTFAEQRSPEGPFLTARSRLTA
jgi:hypothetical protein